MLSLSQITAITGACGKRLEHLVGQGGEVRRAAAAQPVHPVPGAHLERPEHGDLPVRARGEDLRARAAQRPADTGGLLMNMTNDLQRQDQR
jgi:hypothetical protein